MSQVIFVIKVHLFWEGHKILPNLHRRFDRYYILDKSTVEILQTFVVFSEYPDFFWQFWSLQFQRKNKTMITVELKHKSIHRMGTKMSLKCGLLWQNCVLANLGQLVLADIYNCNAIYTLQNLDRMYDNNLEPKLTLIQKASLMAFLRNFLDKMSTNWVLSFLKSFIAQSLWQETFKLPVEGQPALRITLSVSQSVI